MTVEVRVLNSDEKAKAHDDESHSELSDLVDEEQEDAKVAQLWSNRVWTDLANPHVSGRC
jgi:hypothetical protein